MWLVSDLAGQEEWPYDASASGIRVFLPGDPAWLGLRDWPDADRVEYFAEPVRKAWF